MINTQDKFSIFIPIEFEKSKKTGEDRYSSMFFKGIASNPNLGRDKQGQILDPKGFDLEQFLSAGNFNWNHKWKDKPTAIIGEPTVAKITKSNELYIEGRLYPSSQTARDVYDIAEIMEKDSETRRMGFSIEGIPLEVDSKDSNRITKAKITNVAITPSPICPGTRMELIKGGLEDLQFENQDNSQFLIDVTQNGIRYTVNRNLVIQKSITAGSITGTETADQSLTQEPLKEESIEGVKKKKKKTKIKQQLSKSEALLVLANQFNLDGQSANRVWQLANAIEINK